MKTNFKNKIIKLLGGYTVKEFNRIERKYQGLLDSKTNEDCVQITNEYIYRTIKALDDYAKNQLYGLPGSKWSEKMYNVIHNNMLRILIRYLHMKSSSIYEFDITLDDKHQFKHILADENNLEALNKLKNIEQ